MMRTCAWCREAIAVTARRDALFCSKRCRQAHHRFQRGCVARGRAERPLRLAYADPPYPGTARRYYADHPDYAGEVDHAELLSRLQGFDGWALSTSAAALRDVLASCGPGVRVAAWFRGERPTSSAWPLSSWEPVVFAGGRQLPSRADRPRRLDALVKVARPRLTDPARVIGAKPADFCWWLFDLLGALPGDELVDLFPGSGGIGRAWQLYSSPEALDDRRRATLEAYATRRTSTSRHDASRGSLRDTRRFVDEHDTSLLEHGHASSAGPRDASDRGPGDASCRAGEARRAAA